jgi:hypothetical protein
MTIVKGHPKFSDFTMMSLRNVQPRSSAGVYNAIRRIWQAAAERAAYDWREATWTLWLARNRPHVGPKELDRRKRAEETIAECETFFKSGWFHTMTGVNGCYILRRLKDDMEECKKSGINPYNNRTRRKM